MALRRLKAEKEKNELTLRLEQIETEQQEVENDLQELVLRSEEIEASGTDEDKAQLLDEDDLLETRKAELEEEKANAVERMKELDEMIKEFGKGEIVEKTQEPQKVEQRDALNMYLHKKDMQMEEVRAAGLVSEDAEVLIPEEIIYQPKDEIYTEQDLEQYINQVSVSTPTGKYPIMLRTQEKMHTVAELAENPRLQNPKFKEVTWSVETFRAYIPISQEALDDSAVDLLALVSRHILRIVLNTTNSLVAPLIKSYQHSWYG